jgi:hypothetical protein
MEKENMSLRDRLWSFLNSGLGLLLLGFCITTIVGGLFADWMQRRTWERQIAIEQARQDYEWERSMKFELLRAKLKEGQESLEDISDLINLRFYRLQRVLNALLGGNLAASEKEWAEYMPTVEKWNTKLIIYQNKLERLVSRDIADQFNNYETDNPELKEPVSLHGHFYVTHKKILAVLECMRKGGECKVTGKMKVDATKSIRQLDLVSDAFVDRVSQVFLDKLFELEQFKISVNPALQRAREEIAHPGLYR